MAEIKQVLANDTEASLIEQLSEAVFELEADNNAYEERAQWVEIKEHFCCLEGTLKKKFEEFKAKENEFKKKEAETLKLIADREAATAAKEQDLLDQVQELKDDAVAVIAEARATHQPTASDAANGHNRDKKVSSSLSDTNSPQEDFSHKTGENAEGVAVGIKPRPELIQFCQQMDAKGILKYTMENNKRLNVIREELSLALESAGKPARLVLDSLDGFYPNGANNYYVGNSANEVAALQGMRKSCVMLMEAMTTFMSRADPGADYLLNPGTKQQAKDIADEWKPKLASAGIDAANGILLEVEAFLQLLSTFRISSEFDEEELCKLVLAVAHRRQTPELCRSLGLTHKMPGVIELLVKNGKQIDAVQFIHAFQLTESFSLVPLLKTYLKDLRRNSQGKSQNMGGGALGTQDDVNAKELAALNLVIRCVEEYKLEADYPLDPLQRRAAQLEKSKADKKRSGESGKHPQPKKQKANERFRGRRVPGFTAVSAPAPLRAPVSAERVVYTGMPERYAPAATHAYDYQVSSQSAYVQQANDQRLYYYPQDDRVAPSSYNAVLPSYDSYAGSGLQPSNQPYM